MYLAILVMHVLCASSKVRGTKECHAICIPCQQGTELSCYLLVFSQWLLHHICLSSTTPSSAGILCFLFTRLRNAMSSNPPILMYNLVLNSNGSWLYWMLSHPIDCLEFALSPEGVHPFVINSLFDSMVTEVRLCVFYHSELAEEFVCSFDIFILIASEICVCIEGWRLWLILNISLIFNMVCTYSIHAWRRPCQIIKYYSFTYLLFSSILSALFFFSLGNQFLVCIS